MGTEYANPESCGLSKSAVANLAEKFAREMVNYEPGTDLTPIVERLGGRITYQDLCELKHSDSGSIQVEPDSTFSIFLPNHTSPERDRFTIAHELGHYVLHFLLPRTSGQNLELGLQAARFGKGQTEFEANWFAASFLMPANAYKEKYTEASGSIERVADFFDVSESAATVRAKALGLE